MSWSVQNRFRLVAAAVAAVLVVIFALTSMVIAIDAFRRHGNETNAPATDDLVRLMSVRANAHQTLEEDSRSSWQALNRPFIRVIAIGPSGQNVFDSEPRGLTTDFGTALADLLRMPSFEAPVPGGRIIVSPNPDRLIHEIFFAVLWTVPAMVIAIFVILGLAQWMLENVKGELAGTRLDGAGAPRELLDASAISAAQAAFAQNLQRAVAERERAAQNARNFVADAGHELKTPLTVIIGYLDTVVTGLVTEPLDVRRIVEKTISQCRRMRTTIERMIFLARLDREEAENAAIVDIGDLVREIGEWLKPIAPSVCISVPEDGTRPRTIANELALREAIVNVIDNARKYAPQSRIDVDVSVCDNSVVVNVADLGPGMTEADLAHAFDRFHRGSESNDVEGSGLGLAIAKAAIERAQGRITLASRLGEGTRVTMYLPVYAGSVAKRE
ncbi:MAG: HAMP domain-containing histidine kinase [Candidatus Eremiobacteraeota bacterium]|nr:HAMP domain-containing histidine kinase [Candidatus Eremiobacteraeota bacterium]